MNTDPTSPSAILRAIHTPCRLRGSFGPAGAAVLAIVVAVRGGVLLMPTALEADPDGYRAIAGNLLEHGTFGHGEIPTAYRPPLYPLLLAPLLALGPLGRGAIGLLHLGLGLATVWLAWGLAARWGLGRRAALAAALLVACDPLLLSGSALVMTETLAALLAVVSLACLSGASERPTPWRLAATGACLALAILCRPTFLPWTLAAALVLPWLAACKGGRAPGRDRPTFRGGPRRLDRPLPGLPSGRFAARPGSFHVQVLFQRRWPGFCRVSGHAHVGTPFRWCSRTPADPSMGSAPND